MSCSKVSVAHSVSIFLFVHSLLIRFSLLFINLALTVDNLMFLLSHHYFHLLLQFFLRFHVSIPPHATFLLFLFLFSWSLGFILFSVGLLLVACGWNAVEESSVSDSYIRFD